MNCFQISIFAVHEQPATGEKRTIMVVNCFQISIFAVHEQPPSAPLRGQNVVNCFQISIFAVHEQHIPANAETTSRCELLSN